MGDRVDQDARDPADDRAVHADELEVAAHLELDLAGGLGGVPAAHRVRDQSGQLGSVVRHKVGGDTLQPAVHLGPQLRVVAEPGAQRLQALADPGAQLAGGVLGSGQQQVLRRRPRGTEQPAHLGVFEHALLDPLGPLLGLRVVLQVAGELDEEVVDRLAHLVVRVGLDRPGELQRLGVDPLGDHRVEEPRRPGRGAVADDAHDHVVVVAHPVVGAVADEVDESAVRPVGEHPPEEPPQVRCPRPLEDAADHRLLHHGLHVLVPQHLHGRAHSGGELRGHPFRVLGLAQPGPGAGGDLGAAQLVPHDRFGQEVLAHEVAEALAERVLALRDDRGVRDGKPERPAEQGGHREPVRERADHARLGRAAHVPGPGARTRVLLPPRDRVDDEREHQQSGGHGLHPAQPAPFRLFRRACPHGPIVSAPRPRTGPE